MRMTFASLAILATGVASPVFADDACGSVSIAELNWDSAAIAAWVDKVILEAGFGCDVTLVASDAVASVASMAETGAPEIIPEFWYESATPSFQQAVADEKIKFAAALLREGGVQGWWIPKFIADAHPEIVTVEEALKHPELFPVPGDETRGAVHNCPEGWVCRNSTTNLFRASDAQAKGFTLVESASSEDLNQSIADAFEKQYGWLGYYWAPTALLGEYDMVKLSFGVEFDKAEWDRCTVQAECADPKLNAYPVSAVYTLVTPEFETAHASEMDYLNLRTWDNKTVSEVLAWMQENKANSAEAARYFLSNFPNVWHAWLPAHIAAQVDEAL